MYRMLIILNNQLSLTLNLKLLFVPIYGDYSIVGRLVGIVFRLMSIVSGLLVFITILAISVSVPLAWIFIPLIAATYLDINIVVIICALIIYWYLETHTAPKIKIENNKDDIRKSFKKESLDIITRLNTNNQKATINLLKSTNIINLLEKTELLSANLTTKFSTSNLTDFRTLKEDAFNLAKELEHKYVETEHVFFCLLKKIEKIDLFLATYNSELDTIKETIKWLIREREKLDEIYIWQPDYVMPPSGGIGKGSTGRMTPILDSFSEDFTKEVRLGYIKPIIGRHKEIEEIAELLRSEKDNLLLIGEPGSGKTSIIKGIAYQIMTGTSYKSLQNKRIVSINLGKLLAQSNTAGGIASKITEAMDEISGSKDIILFVDEMHDLIRGDAASSSIYNMLEPYLNSPAIQFIGATSSENYRKYIEPNGSFSRMFQTVDIAEATEEDTLEILKSLSRDMEKKYQVSITYPALKNIVKLSKKLIHERVFPDKAIDILIRVVSQEKNKLITSNDVAKQISSYTHIPVGNITENETKKLLNIGNIMQKMVIGQPEAVKQVSEAIKRSRVGIRNEDKPIASFLFVGTTGVGKTQTAKALAKSYFGSKDAMIRIDMSEYQQLDSMSRLIGSPDGKTKGLLTDQVRSKPFSLILLDEIEKAHQNILLTFLQVLDDARLTDSSGTTVDFTNTIIIATSNVGTKEIQKLFINGSDFSQMKDTAMNSVREHFAPEFLNRFNDIIVFQPLSRDSIEKITKLLLENTIEMAKVKGIRVSFKPDLLKEIINRGYNPEWGARPMSREIENTVENYLANNILEGKIKKGDDIELGLEIYQ
jgi:ATP-dependent Clp protease ATP-binding subunit ClpC